MLADASTQVAQRVRAGTSVGATRTFSGSPGFLRKAFGNGWALVGDAGSWKDPASVHGLSDALRDASRLGEALVAAWHGGSWDRMIERTALERYERERDDDTVPLLQTSAAIAGFRAGHGDFERWLAHLGTGELTPAS